MELKREGSTEFALKLEEKKFLLLYSCLGESFQSFNDEKYVSRIGFEPSEARKVIRELIGLMEREGVSL